MSYRGVIACLLAACQAVLVAALSRAEVSPAQAERLLADEAALRATFPEAKVEAVSAYGALTIVALAPQGHLMVREVAGEARLVGYGQGAWQLPPEGSPARALLEALAAAPAAEPAETVQGPVPRMLAASAEAETEAKIEPLVAVNWNQQHPWNLYLPVLGNASQDGAYVGCVGTMFAQLLTAYRWPARVEDELAHAMALDYTSPVSGLGREWFRFDAQVPLPWDDMFAEPITTYQQKHAVSRLSLWADMVASMTYLQTGSTSSIGYCMNQNQLSAYEGPGVTQVSELTLEEIRPMVYGSLAAGCPVGVEINYDGTMAHAIILDGWDPNDGGTPLVHANYGWSGSQTQWYALDALPNTLRAIACNFRPRPRAQLTPLPAPAAAPVLTWDFPAYWAERGLAGWTLETCSTVDQELTTLTDDFSALVDTQVATDSLNGQAPIFTVGPLPENSASGNYLLVSSIQDFHPKTYTWPTLFVPQAGSELTFNLQASCTRNLRLWVQIQAGNAPWQTLHTAALASSSTSAEQAYTVDLSAYAGLPCQLRLRAQRDAWDPSDGAGIFENSQSWRLRNWQVRNVTALATRSTATIDDPTARTFTPTGLAEGNAYAWRLTPRFSDAPAGLASAPVATTVRAAAPAAVDFLEVTDGSGKALDEDFRRACAPAGRTTLRIKLTDGATLLTPSCQNQALLTDEDFALYDRGSGTFELSFTMSGKGEKAIAAYTSNAILLTLRAANGQGNTAAKELLLQFVAGTASDANPETGEVDPGDTPEEGGSGEPSLGGDQTARLATEVLTDEGNLLRFAPGLTYAEGTWSGWVDNSKIGDSTTAFAWASPAANALAWWLANYRKQGGTLSPGTAEAPYIGESATSAGGYDSPIADVFVDCWTTAANDYQPLNALQWLFDGTYLAMGDDRPALKSSALPTGLVRSAIASTLIPDLKAYVGESSSSYTALGTDQAAVTQAFSDYLLDNLTHGPIMVATNSSYLTIWGVEAQPTGTAEAPAWLVKTVYATDPTNAPSALEALPYNGAYRVWISYSPLLGEETLVYRTIPVYAYGHANGQASSGETGGEDPDPEPEPDPTPGDGTVFEPSADPEIPDCDLSDHYGYTIVRDYWLARRLAIAQGKALFVLSGADWCSWCSRVKAYLKTVENFNRDFVVYYASRESSDLCPYFHGSLPQFGTFDPRKADPFAGTLQSDGSRVWANAWVSAGNGQYDSQRGYSEARIAECIQKARAAWKPDCVQNPTFALVGRGALIVGESATFALQATFPADGVVMTLDHRVRWEVDGPATLSAAGVVQATGTGTVTLRATALDDFGGAATAEVTLQAYAAEGITGLALPERILNLEETPTPTLDCLATLEGGAQVPIRPDSWQVDLVSGSKRVLDGFEMGSDLKPELSDEGVLTYREVKEIGQGERSVNICDHQIKVTATRGTQTATRTYTVYGPTQVRPLALELLTSGRVAPGSVVRLNVPKVAYTYAGAVTESEDVKMASYWNNVSGLASSTTSDWQVAIPVTTSASGTYSVNVGARKQGGAYTSYTSTVALAKSLTLLPAGSAVSSGSYANVTTGWLGAYFPSETADEALALADSDGDGYLNWQEFLLGTEPNQADDAFAFTSQHFDAKVKDGDINLYYKVMFTVRPERTYRIEAKVNWGDAWQEVGSFDAETRTTPSVTNVELADSAKFFRVSVGFSQPSGGQGYSADRFTPEGLAIAPGALLDLSNGDYPALTALAMDDYAPGNPRISLPEGLALGTVILSAPANCERWMKCFRPESAAYAFEVKSTADSKRLELVVASPVNPQPKPPTGDPTGDFRDDIKAQLAEAARNAGFTQDFSLRMPERGGSFAEPSVDRVNGVMDCFSGLALEPNAAENTLTIHYDFGIDSMAFVTLEGTPYVVFGAKVTSQVPGSTEPSQADFAEGASLALFGRTNLDETSAQASVVEVTDASGTTAGQCSTPGQRYFRYALPQAPAGSTTTHFFSIRVSR